LLTSKRPSESKAAPALVAAQEQLRKEKLAQALATKIESRPDKEDLADKNILKGMCNESQRSIDDVGLLF
jgi:hypothetical protein